MISYKDLGEKVRIGRESLGLTQDGLAGRAGVSRYTIWRVESGNCGGVSLDAIARILNGAGYDLFVQRGLAPNDSAPPLTDDEVNALIDSVYFSNEGSLGR